jgi:hypothetical protein
MSVSAFVSTIEFGEFKVQKTNVAKSNFRKV